MYTPPFSITDEILRLVAEISEQIGALSVRLGARMPSPMLRKENQIKTIHSSLAIEHNSLSLQQVTDVIEGIPNNTGIVFPKVGSMQVDCLRWEENRVYINSEQYFENVPESAWNFYIGGYQPAQKWLKDRKGLALDFKDVKHYQSIIYVLQQTERIMQEIDKC